MAIKPALTELSIKTAESGFYEGFNKVVTIGGKIIIAALIVWAIAFSDNAGQVLKAVQNWIMGNFNVWYVVVMIAFFLVTFGLALWPSTGRLRLGCDDDRPEFSSFSWFSMMFGAGIGVGMLTYATAEPIYHFQNNPEVIQGLTNGATVANVASTDPAISPADNVRSAYKWSFLHWGVTAWASYSVIGMALAFFSFRRGLPLTIRSGIASLFGHRLSGAAGNIIDITAVIATVLGVAVTLGVGVNQFASATYKITGWDFILDENGAPVSGMIIASIGIIMLASTASALSGVGKGIKWLSNTNMVLSIFVLSFLVIFGSTMFAFEAMLMGMADYVMNYFAMMTTVWSPEVNASGEVVADAVSTQLSGWQNGWTIFYWAWWVAFAPFVGVFLARISRGRTIREYALGSAIIPAVMCFVWFAAAGGTAIDLELSGAAEGRILSAPATQQLFETMDTLIAPVSEWLAWGMACVIFVLLLTYLVTTVDSAILIVNTINAAGDPGQKSPIHIIVWGIGFGLIMAALLLIKTTLPDGTTVDGLSALTSAMIVGAFPFSIVMALMCVALVKAAFRDVAREKAGLQTTYETPHYT